MLTLRRIVFNVAKVLFAEVATRHSFILSGNEHVISTLQDTHLYRRHSDFGQGLSPPFLGYLALFRYQHRSNTVIPPAHLVCLLYATSTIHAKAILVPERAFAIEIHLVVSEKGVLDEFLNGREEILIEQLDLFVLAVR
jgi:hypothetical protein